ncbi:hypothetical protein B0919_08750 [Hymenobacter sp. CRA2]|nr:hypothetical protein B0919_08750 [Hymenobacter sp. CRA2]
MAAAVLIGLGMRWLVGLEPVGWLAWLMPGLLLALAWRQPQPRARLLVLLAALIGTSVNWPYYRLVMPTGAALGAVAAQAALWTFLVLAARRVVLRYRAAWTVLAYPCCGSGPIP